MSTTTANSSMFQLSQPQYAPSLAPSACYGYNYPK